MLWCDGRLHEGTRVPFDLTDRGLTLGDGIFDTALVLNRRMVFREAHVARLAASAEGLGFSIDHAAVAAGIEAVTAALGEGSLRITVTRGAGPRGLLPPATAHPSWWIGAGPLRKGLAFSPVSLATTAIRRNETSPTSRLKTLGYLDAVLAMREAAALGFDDALFLNSRGVVACAGTGNLFVVRDATVTTPPVSDGILGGIVRASILRRSRTIGLEIQERSIGVADIAGADAVFLTNSLRCLAPVRAVDARPFASASNPVVGQIQAMLREDIAGECGGRLDGL